MTTKENWYVCKFKLTYGDDCDPVACANIEKAKAMTKKELAERLRDASSLIVTTHAKITCRRATPAEIKRHVEFYGKRKR